MTELEQTFLKHEKLAERAIAVLIKSGWRLVLRTHRHGADFPVMEIVVERNGRRRRRAWDTTTRSFTPC